MTTEEITFFLLNYLYEQPDQKCPVVIGKIASQGGIDYQELKEVYTGLEAEGAVKITRGDNSPTAMLTQTGREYFLRQKAAKGTISHAEKRELVIRYLARRPGVQCNVEEVLKELGVFSDQNEAIMIGKRLVGDGWAEGGFLTGGLYIIQLASKGVDYCEGTAVQPASSSINYHVTGSRNTNIMVNSPRSRVNQQIDKPDKALEIIQRIREEIRINDQLNQAQREDIAECLDDMQEKLESNRQPGKYQFKTLLDLSSGVSTVAGFAIQLGQLFGPSLPQ